MLRDEPAGDTIVVIRATPLNVDATIDDIAEAATESAEAYEVTAGDRREVLYGVSVFSAQDDNETLAILERFDAAESYLMARVDSLRQAGFAVFATGARADHFDVQLLGGRTDRDQAASSEEISDAARRLVEIAGPLRPNPFYAGEQGGPEQR
ncbi:MAG: hypothetical protein ABIQ73_08310 [Acidimicrobiales bacterium]